jgi:DegV family protein with EDD domain
MTMQDRFIQALRAGNERIVAWADILDEINVYPVPDGDTGRNLVITLGCLRDADREPAGLAQELMFGARGNSGNITARFLTGFLPCRELGCLAEAVRQGRDLAYGAVPDPQPGTILTLLDVLVESLEMNPPQERENEWVRAVVADLEEAVRGTTEQLPQLKEAGVVDAGALGMLLFFEAFLNTLAGREASFSGLSESLRHSLRLTGPREEPRDEGYCLDVVLQVGQESQAALKRIMDLGESVVAISQGECLKVHIHVGDRVKARQYLSTMGDIVKWAEDDLSEQTRRFAAPRKDPAVHVMTDAAGSLTREEAIDLGITLLDSYIHVGSTCLPETYLEPDQLFTAMKKGVRVFTSQASTAERYECYNKVAGLHERVLYLCVGSFYTGNWRAALDWQAENDPDGRIIVMDTGLASGRLALSARSVAELALTTDDPQKVVAHAEDVVKRVQEYIFLHKLQYLAAGGRMSRTGAFVGDILNLKPIVSPFPDGARKMGVVRSTRDQIQFAFDRLEEAFGKGQRGTVLLEYSNNREWLDEEILPRVKSGFPEVRTILRPLSLTSATHMGPGTWGVAFLTDK